MTEAIHEGQGSATPYLIVPGVERLMDFLKEAFGAKEIRRILWPDATIMRAQVRIGDSLVLLGEPFGEATEMPGSVYLLVHDADAAYERALAAGAAPVVAPTDAIYGDRLAGVKDEFGNVWWLATHQEEPAPEEMAKRMTETMPETGPFG